MKVKSTKSALLMSFTSLLLCFAMLIGCTFAWFTDTATANVCQIQSGKLDVDLQMKNGQGNWVSAEGQTLDFVKAAGGEGQTLLFEPGCTYALPDLQIVNNGNLAFKYKFALTGATGDLDLLNVLDFTVTVNGTPKTFAGAFTSEEYFMKPTDGPASVTISAHMKEDAGNQYQGKTITGIAITVYATQMEHEFDSNGNNYDANADGTPDTPEANNLVASFEVAKPLPKTKAAVTESVKLNNNDESFSVEIPAEVVQAVVYGENDTLADNVETELNLNVKPTTTQDANIVTEGQAAQAYEVKLVAVTTTTDGATGQQSTATENITDTGSYPITVSIKVGTGLDITAVKHAVEGQSALDVYTKGNTLTFDKDAQPSARGTFTYVDDVVSFQTLSFSPVYVIYDAPAARIGTTNYGTLEEAIANVTANQTITLLKNSAGNGVSVENKNFILDFNGYTYTIVGPTLAGSTGTKTQCFQLKAGSTITFKNGAIIANNSALKMIIQNYCDLTLQNMTLDATKGENAVNYVLSNNCGNVNINGNTSITAKDGCHAFDAYYWPTGSSAYEAGVKVNINTTGTIKGIIKLDADGNYDEYKNTVNISNGNFVGGFNVVKGNLSITGGTFSSDPTAYCVGGAAGVLEADGMYHIKKVFYISPDGAAVDVKDCNNNIIFDNLKLFEALNSAHTEDGATYYLAEGTYVSDTTIDIAKSISLIGQGQGVEIKKESTVTKSNHVVLRVSGRDTPDTVCVTLKNITLNANHVATINSSSEPNKVGDPSLAFSVFNAYVTCNNCTFKNGNSGGVQLCAHNAINVTGKADTTTSAVLNNCQFIDNWDWRDGGTSGKLTDIKIEFKDNVYPNRAVNLELNDTNLVTKTEKNNPIVVEYNNCGHATANCNITLDGANVMNNDSYVKIVEK